MGFATAAAVIGIGSSLAQTGSAIAQENKMQKAIDEFKPQELINPYESVRLDTTGAEQRTAANISNVATSVEALQRTGARGVAAGVPRLTESSIILQEAISADLSRQARERDVMIARGEERIQQMEEQREREILAGLGQGLNVARQDIMGGVQGVVSSTLALGSSLNRGTTTPPTEGATAQVGTTTSRPVATTASTITPAGVSGNYVQPVSSLVPAGVQNVAPGGLPIVQGFNPLIQNF